MNTTPLGCWSACGSRLLVTCRSSPGAGAPEADVAQLLDDGRAWEVDDAIDAEGREWDLELEIGSLVISKKDD